MLHTAITGALDYVPTVNRETIAKLDTIVLDRIKEGDE